MRAFEYAPSPDPRKTLVQTGEQFEAMLRRLRGAPVLIFDFETTGLQWFKDSRACGLALGAFVSDDGPEVDAFYVPFRHAGRDAQLDVERVGPALAALLGDPGTLKVAHNHGFDALMARREGWHVRGPRWCTLVGAKLHDEHARAGLKDRAVCDLGDARAHEWAARIDYHAARQAKHYGVGLTDYRARLGYSEVPVAICGRYACWDVAYCAGLYHLYSRRLQFDRAYARVVRNEMALLEVLEDVEWRGMPVDADYLCELRERIGGELRAMEGQIARQVPGGRAIELSNDRQVLRLLTEGLRLPLTKRTPGGESFAVDREVLKEFAEQAPVLDDILAWRELAKVSTTYTDQILRQLDTRNWVHCQFVQTGTKTGRLSCRSPNLQNLPGDSDKRATRDGPVLKAGGRDPLSVRRAFLVPDGMARLYLDYSQVELRVIAWQTRDPILLDSYAKGEDVHARTGREVFGRDDEVGRKRAKAVNFGISYCMSHVGLSRRLKCTPERAQEHLARYHSRYVGIEAGRQRFWRAARQSGGTFANGWGRPQRMPNLMSAHPRLRAEAERQSYAGYIQGTAAELTKESMVRIHRALAGSGAHIVATIHDEIQVDCPIDRVREVAEVMRACMEDYPEFAPVPMLVEPRVAWRDWSEVYAEAAKRLERPPSAA